MFDILFVIGLLVLRQYLARNVVKVVVKVVVAHEREVLDEGTRAPPPPVDDDNNNDDDDDIGEPPDSREREERKQHAKVMRDTKIYYKIHLRSEIQKSAFNKVDEDESRRGRRMLYHRSDDSKYKR